MNDKKKAAKGSAPGQYLGYGLQPVRLFYHLLKCEPDSLVGLEYADDVSVHRTNGTVLVEQCKSALSSNPITNWSQELWKTFANWIENANDGFFDPKTTQFRLYVTPQRIAKFAQRLSDAKSDTDIELILKAVGDGRKKLNKVPACDTFLGKVLATDEQTLLSIIRNFELINEDADPLAPIFDYLDPTVSTLVMKEACRWGIGHAKELVERRIRQGEEPTISAMDFRREFKAFINKYDAAGVLHSLVETPTDEMVDEIVSKAPPFIRQLEIVRANAETKTRAASALLQSSADRTGWADQGLIFEASGVEYDDALKLRHHNMKGEVEITQSSLPDHKRGMLLYHMCCNGVSGKLQGREVPGYFMQGSLNSIADRLEIGWHPDYLGLLNGGQQDE